MSRPRRHQAPVPTLPRPTDRVALPAGGPGVSPVCIGATTHPDVVPAAYDAGINFFFLSGDLHWPLYEGTRRGLERLFARGGGVRDEVVVAVASYVGASFSAAPVLEVLQAVPGLDRVDVTVVGGAYAVDLLPRLHAHAALRSAGLAAIRHVAASLHDRRTVVSAVEHGMVDLAFLRYNPLHPGADEDVFPHLVGASRTPVYSFKSLDGWTPPARCAELGLQPHLWRPRPVDHYRWALSQSRLDGLLVAPQSPAEVRGLVDALAEGQLSDAERAYMVDLADLAAGRASLAAP